MNNLLKRFLIWHFQERTKRVVNILKPYVHGATLDVGCGNGDVTKNLNHDDITGIEVCIPARPRMDIKLFNGTDIPFADKSFDTVLCITALHHAEKPDVLVEEMKRVGKKLVILEDNFDNFIRKKSVLWIHALAKKLIDMPYEAEKFKSCQSWEQFFTEHNLKVVCCTEHPSIVPMWPFLGHYLFVLEPA